MGSPSSVNSNQSLTIASETVDTKGWSLLLPLYRAIRNNWAPLAKSVSLRSRFTGQYSLSASCKERIITLPLYRAILTERLLRRAYHNITLNLSETSPNARPAKSSLAYKCHIYFIQIVSGCACLRTAFPSYAWLQVTGPVTWWVMSSTSSDWLWAYSSFKTIHINF